MTNRVFQSFSKRLSRRLLIVFILTITVISALVVTLATFGMKTMTDAYFYSQLEEINEMVSTVQAMGESNDQIYDRMKRADIRINKFYPIVPEIRLSPGWPICSGSCWYWCCRYADACFRYRLCGGGCCGPSVWRCS